VCPAPFDADLHFQELISPSSPRYVFPYGKIKFMVW